MNDLSPQEALAAATVTARFTGEADIIVLVWIRGDGPDALVWPCLTMDRALQEAATQIRGDYKRRGRQATETEVENALAQLKEGISVEILGGIYEIKPETLRA